MVMKTLSSFPKDNANDPIKLTLIYIILRCGIPINTLAIMSVKIVSVRFTIEIV